MNNKRVTITLSEADEQWLAKYLKAIGFPVDQPDSKVWAHVARRGLAALVTEKLGQPELALYQQANGQPSTPQPTKGKK